MNLFLWIEIFYAGKSSLFYEVHSVYAKEFVFVQIYMNQN